MVRRSVRCVWFDRLTFVRRSFYLSPCFTQGDNRYDKYSKLDEIRVCNIIIHSITPFAESDRTAEATILYPYFT